MDRLPTVRLALLAVLAAFSVLAAACDERGGDAAPSTRVNAVMRDPNQTPQLDAFCDVRQGAERARSFAFPALAEGRPAPASRWRSVNVWATWCAPCV